jgi:DNA polymerase III epsilon subunit family exonuclease
LSAQGGPFGSGHGPGESRDYGRRGRPGGTSGNSAAGQGRYGGARAVRLTGDEIDALLAAVGKVRFVAFDFETTGLDAGRDRIVEIGAVGFRLEKDSEGWKAVPDGEYESLVNPGCPIPPEVSAIHGIDDLAVSSAPYFKDAASDFFPFIDGSILVAHNAPFDLGFLKAEAARAGLENPPNPAWDTVSIAKTAISGLPSYSLKSLASSFGINQTAAHRGADDARVCMELFVRCINLIDSKN